MSLAGEIPRTRGSSAQVEFMLNFLNVDVAARTMTTEWCPRALNCSEHPVILFAFDIHLLEYDAMVDEINNQVIFPYNSSKVCTD